jgi:hypothetical protein
VQQAEAKARRAAKKLAKQQALAAAGPAPLPFKPAPTRLRMDTETEGPGQEEEPDEMLASIKSKPTARQAARRSTSRLVTAVLDPALAGPSRTAPEPSSATAIPAPVSIAQAQEK